jgi:hypothetical protein
MYTDIWWGKGCHGRPSSKLRLVLSCEDDRCIKLDQYHVQWVALRLSFMLWRTVDGWKRLTIVSSDGLLTSTALNHRVV